MTSDEQQGVARLTEEVLRLKSALSEAHLQLAAREPDNTLMRCTICGFVVDTKYRAEKPTTMLRPSGER